MSTDRLCFGTSTFAAGRLQPDKDSRPGIEALALACRLGVSRIHSNPKLGTQWAIREATELAGLPPLRHVIKAEAPLDASRVMWADQIEEAVHASCEALGVGRVNALVWEIDLKRTSDLSMLAETGAVRDFVSVGSMLARGTGRVDSVVAYCHSPRHLLETITASGIDGIAAQYNLAEPWPVLYLSQLRRAGLGFLGMAPLRHGLLAPGHDLNITRQAAPGALQWALADPRVTAAVITMSHANHVRAALAAAAAPFAADLPHVTARSWLRRLDQGANPGEGHPATPIHSELTTPEGRSPTPEGPSPTPERPLH